MPSIVIGTMRFCKKSAINPMDGVYA